MFQLSEEELLMFSEDKSVRLTTHRIICDTENKREQIMLEDVVSYEIQKTSLGFYRELLWFVGALLVWITYQKATNYIDGSMKFSALSISFLEHFLRDTGYLVLCGLLLIVIYLYMVSRRNYIKISGKYSTFHFRVRSFRNKSIKRMLDKMMQESAKIKSGNLN